MEREQQLTWIDSLENVNEESKKSTSDVVLLVEVSPSMTLDSNVRFSKTINYLDTSPGCKFQSVYDHQHTVGSGQGMPLPSF